jgi:hypothetical protein
MSTQPKSTGPKNRCAIYTRKSCEEGLELEFNSLHAQRESAEAFPDSRSQRPASMRGPESGLFSGSRGVCFPQLLCLVRKLTAVGYSKKPASCSNAKHRLFSCFPAIFRVSTTLQRPDFRSRRSPIRPLSGGQSETNTLRLSGL